MYHVTTLNISYWNDTMLSDDYYYTVTNSKKSLFSEQKIQIKKGQIFIWKCKDFYTKFLGMYSKGTNVFKKANSYTAVGRSSSANAHFSKLKNPLLHVFHSHILFLSCPKEDKMTETLADSCTWNSNKILCYHWKHVSGVQGKGMEEELPAAKFMG